ncbi:MAG: hypothetical protein RBS80_29165 [Thermoguttaceae bacterium]|nr:hypothetical protein [Thermoguttaceae bacterium]
MKSQERLLQIVRIDRKGGRRDGVAARGMTEYNGESVKSPASRLGLVRPYFQ